MNSDSLGYPLQEFQLDWDSLLPLTLHNFYFWHKHGDLTVFYSCGGMFVFCEVGFLTEGLIKN